MIYSARIFHFLIPAWNFQDMLAIGIALKISRDTSSIYIGIQDGGQNSKWLPVMHDVVYISLFLPYTVDIHVEVYAVEYIEYKYINLNLKEHQDDRQNPRCLSKIEWCNLSTIWFWTTIFNFRIPACNFQDMLAINTALKLSWDNFHLHRNLKWRPKLKMAIGDNIMFSISLCLCTTKFIFIQKCMLF